MQHPPHGDGRELFQLHNRKLVHVIRRRFRLTEEEARDVAQFALLKFVEKQPAWREALGEGGANSTVDALIQALPDAPVTTVYSASALIRRDEQTVSDAILRLVDAGVLTPTTVGRRTCAYEAADLVETSTDLERRLAHPDGDC
jgi:hypothetical protein